MLSRGLIFCAGYDAWGRISKIGLPQDCEVKAISFSIWQAKRHIETIVASATALILSACGSNQCTKYASSLPCAYVEHEAEYEIWYWRNVQEDNEEDNKLVGRAIGLHRCEENARAFAAAVGETFSDRSYICVLTQDGLPKEKHRLITL